MGKTKTINHDDYIIDQIKKDEKFGLEYLNEALQSDSENWMEEFIIALGHFAKSKGLSPASLSDGRSRDAIYKVLNQHRNPTLKTFKGMVGKMGMELSLKRRKG